MLKVVTDPADLPLIVSRIQDSAVFVFDVETMPAAGDKTEKGETRGDPWRNNVVWIAISDGFDSWVIPMGHPNGDFVESKFPLKESAMRRIEKGLPIRPQDYSTDPKKEIRVFTDPPDQLTRTEVFAALKPLFMDDTILKVGHNLGFDLGSVTKYVGAIPEGPYFDTMIAAFLIDSDRGFGFGLKDISKKYANIDMEKGVGARIEMYGFDEVTKYAALDVEATTAIWKILSKRIESDSLTKVMKLEMDVLRVVTDMRLTGAVIDTESLSSLKDRLEKDIEAAKGKVFLIAGEEFNLNSTAAKQRLLFDKKANGGRGLTPKTLTPGGKVKSRNKEPLVISDYSVSAEALEGYRSTDPLVDAILEYQDLNKLNSTYVLPYMGGTVTRTTNGRARQHTKVALMDKGRLHTDFNQIGAATGRFSCVAGETMLPTNRGRFRFDEYLPVEGDLVLTHAGNWMPVVRKIYKGVAPMFRVVLDNGSTLYCTKEHRVLTFNGWEPIGSLSVGSKVASYGSIESVRVRLGEPEASPRSVSGAAEAHSNGDGEVSWDYSAECSGDVEIGIITGTTEGRDCSPVLSFKDGREEPYAGQEWFPAPQPQGSHPKRARLSSEESWEEVHSGAPLRHGAGVGVGETSTRVGCPSHRPEQVEQFAGELGLGDEGRSHETSRNYSRIVEITPVGAMGVWDIEVAGDHSYLAHGFINHNSRNPNLQNVPHPGSEYGKLIRNLFVAPEGHRLVVADYSQIEPRLIASFSKDPVMLDTYMNGGDIYTAIGDIMGVDRKAGKVLVLSIAYGVGPEKIATSIGCTVDAAKDLLEEFAHRFKNITRLKALTIRTAKKKTPVPFVVTLAGRRRYLPDLNSDVWWQVAKAERQAFNTLVQGSAADIMKIAMVKAYNEVPEKAEVILTVHDELVTVTPSDIAEETAEAIRSAMENIRFLKVPLIADVKIVDRWGEAK